MREPTPVIKTVHVTNRPKVIAMVCAKGDSTRLPMKNLRMFAGKPLVEWTMIQHAASHLIDRNYLVTESVQVAEIGERYGFDVIWETEEEQEAAGTLGGPNTVVRWLEKIRGKVPKDVLSITTLPSSPNRYPADIDNSIKLWFAEQSKSDIPVTVSAVVTLPSIALQEPKEGGRYFFSNTGCVMSAGGYGVNPLAIIEENAEWVVKNCGQHDHHIEPVTYKVTPKNVYYHLKLWQWHDIDNLEQFELCENLFKAHIGGEEPYIKYKEDGNG